MCVAGAGIAASSPQSHAGDETKAMWRPARAEQASTSPLRCAHPEDARLAALCHHRRAAKVNGAAVIISQTTLARPSTLYLRHQIHCPSPLPGPPPPPSHSARDPWGARSI
ncbi:hypothetical protein PMIN06_009661 [Paraphaeosphaeria minitans]